MGPPPTAATLPAWLNARLRASLAEYPCHGLCVGYSGGLDSSVLLHALAQAPSARSLGLSALHVHHGLHPDADAWCAHCARVCTTLAVPFNAVRVSVDATAGDGPEGAARRARMQAFAEHLARDQWIALAHHQDDQAETFLLRALRGSGPGGLGAMSAWRPHGDGALWRPLLELPRRVLHDYAQRHGLAWIEDPANVDRSLARNVLRLEILPVLQQHWPGVVDNFARAARLNAEAEILLAGHDADLLAVLTADGPARLDLASLATLSPMRRARVLRAWIAAQCLPPIPHAHLKRIEHEVLPATRATGARVQWQDVVVARWRGGLHAFRAVPPWPRDWTAPWDGTAPLPLPDGGELRLCPADTLTCAGVRLPFDGLVQARRGGERVALPGRTHRHAVKMLLHDSGLPPWERERLPLLHDRAVGQVQAVADRWLSAGFSSWLARQRLSLRWTSPPASGIHPPA